MQFVGRSNLKEMSVLGPALKTGFDDPGFRLYRIAGDAVAILGRLVEENELERRLAAFLELAHAHQPTEIGAGYADLSRFMRSPQHWFDCAGVALEDALRSGVNHFRMYRPPAANAYSVGQVETAGAAHTMGSSGLTDES